MLPLGCLRCEQWTMVARSEGRALSKGRAGLNSNCPILVCSLTFFVSPISMSAKIPTIYRNGNKDP